MKKRILCLLLVCAMAIGMLSGCGEKEAVSEEPAATEEVKASAVKKEGYPITDEKMNLSVLAANTEIVTDPAECDIHNEIAEVTNVDIEWELIDQASWPEKKGLVFARTELPDVILANLSGISDAEYLNMVNAGQLVAIDEYFDYAPNFQKVLENSPGMKEAITAADGHIYAIPYFIGTGEDYSCMTNNVTYINQVWLDNLGLKMPTTTEELKEVLVAFKEKDPNGNGIADEIPLTVAKDYAFDDWFGSFGIVPSANELMVQNLTIMDGEIVYAATQDEYRAALDYFHELWELGVIDPEVFTQDDAMLSAKQKAETRVAGMFKAWRGTSWRLSDEDTEYEILPALEGPEGDSLYPQRYSGIISRASALITSNCDNIELAVRWIDTLIDPQYGYQFWTDHRAGYHFTDDGSEKYQLAETYNINDPVHNKMVDMKLICVDYTTVAKVPVNPNPLTVDNEKAVSDAIYKPNYPKEHYPNAFLTLDESSTIAEINADLDLYMKEFYAGWIVNGGDDAAWANHLEQLENLGVNEWVEVYKAAYDRYNAS